ncbi:MAG: acylphosphatase [Patescibacteria group bacterium]
MQEIHCLVFGRVQMVMFRDFTARGARSLGLTGFVRNLADGSVEVVAQGAKEKLEALVVRLKKGSLLSRVDNVQVTWCEATQSFDGFIIAL